jgi:hypothetical protein
MSATGIAEVLNADCMESLVSAPLPAKGLSTRRGPALRDILRLQTRQVLTEAELAEVAELRKKLKRIDADVAMMLVIRTSLHGGWNWF